MDFLLLPPSTISSALLQLARLPCHLSLFPLRLLHQTARLRPRPQLRLKLHPQKMMASKPRPADVVVDGADSVVATVAASGETSVAASAVVAASIVVVVAASVEASVAATVDGALVTGGVVRAVSSVDAAGGVAVVRTSRLHIRCVLLTCRLQARSRHEVALTPRNSGVSNLENTLGRNTDCDA